MSVFFRYTIVFAAVLLSFDGGAQSSLREKQISVSSDTLVLDTLSIYPNSFELYCGDSKLTLDDYSLDFASATLILRTTCSSRFLVKYRVLPMNLSLVMSVRVTSIVYNQNKGPLDKFLFSNTVTNEDIFGGNSLSKTGSISRGVTFGNNQNLGVNSTLNLELTGQIAPNLFLLASVSDDNLPIQPDGNTNKLQEFDQIFIQISNDRLKMIAGDFWLNKPTGYFMSYKKRAQGLNLNYQWSKDTLRSLKTEISGAMSRGKFQRQIINGIEGNQGPYRLIGSENEPFIIVLSGTERVFIDGRLLDRGQEYDYVIDYNTAEVTFTSRNQITKDSRIVVEFQYSDQNYVRSLFQTSTVYQTKKVKAWLNVYSEQDAKNQTLQQDLSISQKRKLSEIGDTLSLARISSIDSVGFFENQNLYLMKDSLSFDSVLVSSVAPDSAIYRATFEFVGQGNGDYVFSHFNALGKVYKWVMPVGGLSVGDYAASRLIVTPKKRQLVTAGYRLNLTKRSYLETELVLSNNDVNTFSRFNSNDNQSGGGRVLFVGDIPFSKDSISKWILRTKVEVETLEKNFIPIEQYRKVEFDRDWNTRNKGYIGNQLASKIGASVINRNGEINLEGQQYLIGGDYEGYRGEFAGRWNQKGFSANWNSSYLKSAAEGKNDFIRQKVDLSQNIGWFKIGFIDDQEQNKFRNNQLDLSSYGFFDYQFYVSNSDSIRNKYKIFYRERYDQRSDSVQLKSAAKATTIGGEITLSEWKDHRLNILGSYRELEILDKTLINITPENTLLGRVDYEMKAFKGAIHLNTFYEIGSGLELKREFLYIQVNDGQGVYTWVDYNNDNVKDLNEFEIAQYADQASYIRVFTPSNQYVKTYSNEYNQSINLRPERVWSNKKGVLKFITRFSDQARFRINRKTDYFNVSESFNPFVTTINDTNLIAINSNIRNTLYFNRNSNIAGVEYSYQNTSSKSLLASGFDSRFNEYNEVTARWNIIRKITIKVSGTKGIKASEADYTSGRNYRLDYVTLEPSIIFQPNTIFRLTLDGRLSEKKNAEELGGELSTVQEVGSTFKINQAEKGSLQGGMKLVNIDYSGIQNSALGFEMLEALKPGVNYTWNIGYQRSISKSLQLSIMYNGRKSLDTKSIHSGGMELRAFF